MQSVCLHKSLTRDVSTSGFSSIYAIELKSHKQHYHQPASSFLKDNRRSHGFHVRFDLDVASSQREIPLHGDENEFIRSVLYYNRHELEIMTERMNQDVQSFGGSSGTFNCRKTFRRVLSHCEAATSDQHFYTHSAVRQKLREEYELFGDEIIGLERYIVDAFLEQNVARKRQAVLSAANDGAYPAIKIITLSSSMFASEIASAQAFALANETAADSQNPTQPNKGACLMLALFDFFKNEEKDDMVIHAQNKF